MKKDLINRRDFFRKAATNVLPMLACVPFISALSSCVKDDPEFTSMLQGGGSSGGGNGGSGNGSGGSSGENSVFFKKKAQK